MAVGDFIADASDAFALAAQAAIRRWCGWHVAPAAEVSGTLPSRGGRILRLPLRAVSGVSELSLADGTDALARAVWTADGLIEFDLPVPPGIAAVSYTATAGYDVADVPDLVEVARQVAARAAQAPAGSVKSQSVNGASVTYGFSGSGAASVALLSDEKERLEPFRIARLP